jgi:hypothetical protein
MQNRTVSILAALVALAPSLLGAEEAKPRRVLHAVRAAKAPAIDADLSDEAWKNAEEVTGFTQREPKEGEPSSQKTVVKIVYDNDAIYFGAMLYDTNPVTTLLARRDTRLASDWFRINLSPQHDGLSGAGFWVNPSNVQLDGILYNDIYDDYSWDGVWSSAAKIVPGGWIAEVRIPYSQLRFSENEHQVWGIDFTREISKNHEIARLVHTPKKETGFVSRMAELTGIDGIRPERAFEVVPYGVARSDLHSQVDNANPFASRSEMRMDGGVDVKYGLSSGLTLTGTLNPDFGQVEVDPAVVNLSQFETFFPEKRPFFTEGSQMFRYGNGPASSRFNFNLYPPQFFYSRRIGRSPQGGVDAQYVDAPGETTILGAGKVTGKFGKGWSIGVLDALTNREHARFQRTTFGQVENGRQQVEPMTNYLVARTAKEFRGGNSRVGMLFTAVNRDVPRELTYLRSSAYTLGADGYSSFRNKAWLFEWLAGMTRVAGSKESIAITQRNAAHNYQRPDADYIEYDPERTSLSGFGARVMLGKQTGHWRPNVQAQTYSPGFEVNDVGFMPRTDVAATHAAIQYTNEDVKGKIRERNFWVGKFQNWNYGGDLIANGFYSNAFVEFTNYWYLYTFGGYSWRTVDDRKTRGGTLAVNPADHDYGFGFGSDGRKKFSFETTVDAWADEEKSYSRSLNLFLNYRPSTNIRLSLGPSYSRNHSASQYVATTVEGVPVFSEIEQHTLDVGVRAEWTFSSRLSFQLYSQPFIAAGDYHDFKQLARPRSLDYTASSFGADPDFNFRSVRGSAVARWEFRPGSALYVVWNENRAEVLPIGNFRFRRDFSAIRHAPSQDVFLIKVSYWLPM